MYSAEQNQANGSQSALANMPVQIVVPIYNEGEGVLRLHEEFLAAGVPFDSLKFVYDFDGDTTIPFIGQLNQLDQRIFGEKNQFGKGVINALRWGFAHAKPGPVIVVMGDCSDKLDIIPEMIQLWKNGATVVSPSRYMPGGKQHGGPFIKGLMSRVAGVMLKVVGFPTADPTNNFKLYDGSWLAAQRIESVGGFEVAIELCYHAFQQGKKIVELPTEWRDRTAGESRFQLLKWTPLYLKWWLKIVGVMLKGRKVAPPPLAH